MPLAHFLRNVFRDRSTLERLRRPPRRPAAAGKRWQLEQLEDRIYPESLLLELAKGASGARLTRDARAALDRLEKRP